TDKSVSLALEGTDTLIESNVLGDLIAPLMHILRNAVDHGIEPPTRRESLGKPPGGMLRLRFVQDGSRIRVELEDDGGGFDEAAIVERARALGLLQSGPPPDRDHLARLVLTPGFSTRSEASEISGRGIGLDAARIMVQQMGGTMELDSRPGEGLRVRMRLPQSLSSSHLLFVRVGEASYALPSLAVRQVLFSDAGTIERVGDSPIFTHDDHNYPLTRLADLLRVPGEHALDALEQPRPLVLAESGGGPVALLVDGVIESREAVVKSLSEHIPELRGISGACILADGDLAMVVDLAHMNRRRDAIEPPRPAAGTTRHGAAERAPTVLVVDDSLSARRFLSRLVGDLGMDAVAASDGLDALEKIEQQRPDLLLLDLEMPRMNGLELTAQLRREAATADLPVIMITSRSTIKHREQAERVGVDHYLTKPYQEEQLEELILESLRASRSGA
ncbi:MAG: response regulator, partial [Wenzhouxiangellaceae bacterium]